MDRLEEIRARLDAWERQKAVGTEGWWDGIRHYEPMLCADIAWLLDEVADLAQVNVSLLAQVKRLRGDELVVTKVER